MVSIRECLTTITDEAPPPTIEIGGGAWSLSITIKKESPTKGVVVYMYSILSLIGLDFKVGCLRRPLLKVGGIHLVCYHTISTLSA